MKVLIVVTLSLSIILGLIGIILELLKIKKTKSKYFLIIGSLVLFLLVCILLDYNYDPKIKMDTKKIEKTNE